MTRLTGTRGTGVWKLGAAVVAALVVLSVVGVAPAQAAGETTIEMQPADGSVDVGQTTTFEVVLTDAQGGVGAAEVGVAVDDPSVATITDVTVLGSGSTDVNLASDGSSADVEYAFRDTADTGSVTMIEVTVQGEADGTTGLALVPAEGNNDVLAFDEGGTGYTVSSVSGASLTVGDGDQSDTNPSVSFSQAVTSSTPVQAGETFTVEATLEYSDVNSPGIDITLPEGWTVTSTTDDGGTYSPADTGWAWLEGDADGVTGSHTVTYTVQVPSDATAGDYTVGGEGSGINPADSSSVAATDDLTITVESETQEPQPEAVVVTLESTDDSWTPYQLDVEGGLEKSTEYGGSINPNDDVTDSTATGALAAGRDSYVVEGGVDAIESFAAVGDVTMYVNGQEVDDISNVVSTNTVTLASADDSWTPYQLEANSDLQKSTVVASINPNDDLSGSTVTGALAAGRDSFTYTGDIGFQTFAAAGDTTMYINGQQVDPSTVVSTHTVTLATDDGAYGSYQLTVDANLAKSTVVASINPNDEVTGNSADGSVVAGRDSYEYTGGIVELDTDDNVVVYVDGDPVETNSASA